MLDCFCGMVKAISLNLVDHKLRVQSWHDGSDKESMWFLELCLKPNDLLLSEERNGVNRELAFLHKPCIFWELADIFEGNGLTESLGAYAFDYRLFGFAGSYHEIFHENQSHLNERIQMNNEVYCLAENQEEILCHIVYNSVSYHPLNLLSFSYILRHISLNSRLSLCSVFQKLFDMKDKSLLLSYGVVSWRHVCDD